LDFLTNCNLFGIEDTRLRHIFEETLYHASWNAFHNSSVEVYFIGVSCLLRTLHKFSIGFWWGELPGQGKTLTFLFFRKAMVLFALCGDAKSYWNMKANSGKTKHLLAMWLSCRISFWYFSAFILPWTLLRSPTPWLVKHPQTCKVVIKSKLSAWNIMSIRF